MSLRIGIEAKWYFDGPPSGKRVIRALVDHLLEIDSVNEYYIILNKQHQHLIFPYSNKPNVHLCYVWAGNNLLSNLLALPKVMKSARLDVTLFQNFAPLWGHGKRIAYIHDVLFLSNPEFYTLWERTYFKPLRFLSNRAHAIVTISNEEKKRLDHYGFKSKSGNTYVVHHGIDPSFRPAEQHTSAALEAVKSKYNLPHQYLLFVGRLNARKNIENLLRALAKTQSDIPLVVVGSENWKASKHYETIQQTGIQNRVLFLGSLPEEDLVAVYALAYVFCFPSIAEGFGLPALEAMASGIPVIVSNTTSLPEVCGEAGNYIDPYNIESIAKAIDQLVDDPALYTQKKEQGLAVASTFTWQKAASRILACITETCS